MRIVIAEDHVLLREGIVRLLEESGHTVVAAVDNGPALLAAVAGHRPDLAVLDIRLPPTHTDEGVTTALQLRRDRPTHPVLILSQYLEPAYARDLLATGAAGIGYLLKDRVGRIDQFLAAVEDVVAGNTVVDPEVVNHLMGAGRPASGPLATLTAREQEVLRLMAQGHSNAGIAGQLFLSLTAVEKHVGRVMDKLGLERSTLDNRRVLAVLTYLQASDHPPPSVRSRDPLGRHQPEW